MVRNMREGTADEFAAETGGLTGRACSIVREAEKKRANIILIAIPKLLCLYQNNNISCTHSVISEEY